MLNVIFEIKISNYISSKRLYFLHQNELFFIKFFIISDIFCDGYGKNLEETKEKAAEMGLKKINININK